MAQAAVDPLDALAAQHGAGPSPSTTADPLDALAAQHGATSSAAVGPSMTFAVVNGQRVPVDDAQEPNTLKTLARHVGAQINPLTAVQTVGKALIPQAVAEAAGVTGDEAKTYGPLNAVTAIGAAQGALFDKAKAAYAQGDYLTAARHFVNYLIPLVGPTLDTAADRMRAGQGAAGAGDAIGAGLAMFGPAALTKAAAARYPLAARPAATTAAPVTPAVQFAQQRGVPLDAATVSDNLAVKGTQALADRSLGGSLVATPARAAQAAAMTRVGGELADTAGPMATPEQAGTSIREALTAKVASHAQEANTAYDRLRALEQQPTHTMILPPPRAPVDALSDGLKGQIRRIVHELDASGYSAGKLVADDPGVSVDSHYVPRSGGAEVFHDIKARMSEGSSATRGLVQQQLEDYLAGGSETPVTKAALEVAGERAKARGGYTVSKPELPPSAMDLPTAREGSRVGQEMGLPVDLTGVKAALKPVYDQMRRQMPITQQQANPGLKAFQNILEGDDYAPLSQVDRDLSAIKGVAREATGASAGLAKFGVAKAEAAVQSAASNGTPDVRQALMQGRAATIAKYAASDVLDRLHPEPVRTLTALTAPKDSAIQALRAVMQHVPDQAPTIARAYLEDLLAKPNAVAEWSKLGPQTKAILFPQAGQAQALDRFFALTRRISQTNVNPSGSGYMASLGAQGAMLWYDPLHAIPLQIGAMALATLLRSPVAIKALTQGLTMPRLAPLATRTVTTANLVRAARAAGVPLAVPQAAAGPGSSR